MATNDGATYCERCGNTHVTGWVSLELNTYSGLYSQPGTVPQDESQGLFRFGTACAAAVLKMGGRNIRIRKAK